jgi:hypothetical protein
MGPTNLFLSGGGAQARVIEYTRPLTGKEATELRDKLKELQDKRAAATGKPARSSTNTAPATAANAVYTAEDRKLAMEIRDKLARLSPNKQANPAISESVIVQITLAADAKPGPRELRLECQAGLSNPLRFHIGDLREYTHRAANSRDPEAFNDAKPFREKKDAVAPPRETTIAIPAVCNGQIMPGGVDRFRFHAHPGQHLVVSAAARALIPYLADAVPGWFQASLTLYDNKGKELDHADHFRFQPDPVLLFDVPKEGDYVLEIRDSIYRGREDFVYRLTLGEQPFLTGAFPLGGPESASTTVTLTGCNLPTNQMEMDRTSAGFPFPTIGKALGILNPIPFEFSHLPEVLEQEPNNSSDSAQKVAFPVIINGRIDAPGDVDVFRFEAEAGAHVVAEVMARRLDSPMDSTLRLSDAAGNQLAFNDDYEDKGAGLNTHHADSYLSATLPARGTYFIQIADAQRQDGPEFAYRLRISPPQPDFALRLAPSSLNLRAGTTAPLTVFALRRDGFTNAIAILLKDAPAGFALAGATVPAGQDKVTLTLTAPYTAPEEPIALSFSGRAIIDGESVIRPVIPCDDMMQAFAYRHLVPSDDLLVAVTGRAMAKANIRILNDLPVKIPAGGSARIRVAAFRGALSKQAKLELSQAPDGLSLTNTSTTGEATELEIQCDAARLKPGFKGNLIVGVFPDRPATTKAKAQASRQRPPITVLPAIPFEVIAPQNAGKH